jgi:hypothetical protein
MDIILLIYPLMVIIFFLYAIINLTSVCVFFIFSHFVVCFAGKKKKKNKRILNTIVHNRSFVSFSPSLSGVIIRLTSVLKKMHQCLLSSIIHYFVFFFFINRIHLLRRQTIFRFFFSFLVQTTTNR